ncbi:BASS4 [Symbiodinium sp. CCMP2456]|nr:BASS4 [Symbiodinium sp. CCMP2456]
MGRTRSRPPRHVREASQAAKKIPDATGTSSTEPAAPTQEQKPKLSQQQLALKWEMQWRPSAAQGTPYSYGKSCGGWVKKQDAKQLALPHWLCRQWSSIRKPHGMVAADKARRGLQVALEHRAVLTEGAAQEPRGPRPVACRSREPGGKGSGRRSERGRRTPTPLPPALFGALPKSSLFSLFSLFKPPAPAPVLEVSGLGPSPAFAGKRTVFQELAKSKRKRKPVQKGQKLKPFFGCVRAEVPAAASWTLDWAVLGWLAFMLACVIIVILMRERCVPNDVNSAAGVVRKASASAQNFLILGLLAVITFGLVCPAPGEALDGIEIGRFRLPQVAVIVIFVVSGLCLDSISECLQYKALTLSVVLVLGVTPLLAYPILHYGQGYVEETLLEGLAVFCVVPTTLSSGVTMVTQAKGNVSLAVLLTTITNLLGVATMPWSVSKIFAAKVPIKPSEMLFELIWLTLVPLVVGMGLREVWPAAKSFAKTNKKVLGLCQNSCILLVVLLMTSSAQPKIVSTDSYDLSCALGIAAGIHLVYRVVGYFSATAAVLEPREWVTVVLMSSQKSLPVCVSVMSALPPVLRANSGLMIVPCIMAHASQLIIDSILAVRWEVKEEKQAPLLPS